MPPFLSFVIFLQDILVGVVVVAVCDDGDDGYGGGRGKSKYASAFKRCDSDDTKRR